MKNVMHIISGDLWAGAESQAYTFLKALHKTNKYNLISVVFNKGELFRRLVQEGIDVYLIDESRYNTIQILWRMMDLIRNLEPDIIHTHKYKSNILAVCSNVVFKKRARVLRTLHGLTQAPHNIRYLKSHIALWIENIILSHCTDCIIAVSRSLEKQLHEKYPRTSIKWINNAIEIPEQPVNSRQTIRSAHGVSPDTIWIATAARLVPVKNLEMLIEAVMLFKGMTSRKIHVTIFGDGPLRQNIQDRIHQYGIEDMISIYGYHSDIMSIMHAWDAFVLTSKSEGLPMSLIEVMSFGVIPICTRVGGVPEVIEDGINGFLVEPCNSKEMAEKIAELIQSDPEAIKSLKSKARETILEKYSIQTSIGELISLYGD